MNRLIHQNQNSSYEILKTLFQIMQHRSCTYHIHTHRITINLIELQAALIPLLGSESYTRSGKIKIFGPKNPHQDPSSSN